MPTFEELFPEYAGAPPSRPFEPIRPRALDAPMSRARRMAIDVTGTPGAEQQGFADLDEMMKGYKPAQPQGEVSWADQGKSFMSGLGSLGQAGAGAGEYIANTFAGNRNTPLKQTIGDFADKFASGRRAAGEFAQDWFASMSPEAQARAVREITTLDPDKTIWQGGPGEFLSSLSLKMSNAAPSTLVTLLPGGLIMRAGLGSGAITYLGASEGVLSMGSIAANIADEIEQAPEAELMQSQRYATLRQSMGEQEARQQLTREAQGYAPVIGGLTVGAISALAGRYLEPVFTGKGGSFTQRAVRGAIAEGPLQEGPQSFAEQVAQNVAAQTFDSNRGTFEGAGEATVQGSVVGAGMGGGFSSIMGRSPEPEVAPPSDTIPGQEPAPTGGEPFQQVFAEQTPPTGGWRGGDVEFQDYDDTPLTRTDAEGNVIQQPARRDGFMLRGGVAPDIESAMQAKQMDMLEDQQSPLTPEIQAKLGGMPFEQQGMNLPQGKPPPFQTQPPLGLTDQDTGRVIKPTPAQPLQEDMSAPPGFSTQAPPPGELARGRRPTRADFLRERQNKERFDLTQEMVRDPRQQDMFAPEGPVQPPDEPSAEPIGDLNAQLEDLADPDSPRLGVYLSAANMSQLGDIPDVGVPLADFDGRGGTLIAKNRGIAEQLIALRAEGNDMQQILGLATGAGIGKPAGANIAVQQRDERGNVVRESAVASPEEADELAASFETPGRESVILSPEQVIRRREQRIALEQRLAHERKTGKTARRTVEELGGGERARDVAERLAVLRERLAHAERESEEGPTRSARLKAAQEIKTITRDIEQTTARAAKAARRAMPDKPDVRKTLEETPEQEIAKLDDEQLDEVFREAVQYVTGLQGRIGGMAGGKMFGGDTSQPQAFTKELAKRVGDSPELLRLKEILNVTVPSIQARLDKKGQSDRLRHIWLKRLIELANETKELQAKLDKIKPKKNLKMFPATAEAAEAETREFMRKTLPNEVGTRETAEMRATTSVTPTGRTTEQIEAQHQTRAEKLKYIARAKRKLRERDVGKRVKTKEITATGKVEERQVVPERLKNAIRLTQERISKLMREGEPDAARDAQLEKLYARLKRLDKKAQTKRETEYLATRKKELTPSRAFDLEPPREMSAKDRAEHNARVRTTYKHLDKTMLKFSARLEKANEELLKEAQKREAGGNPPHNARNAIYGRAYFNELFRYGQLLDSLHPRSKRGLKEVEKFIALLDKLLSAKGEKFFSALSDAMQAESRMQARGSSVSGMSKPLKRRAEALKTNAEVATKIKNAKHLHDVWHKEPLFNDVVAPLMQKLIGYMTHDSSPAGALGTERRGLGYTPTFAELRRLRAALMEFQRTNYDKLYEPVRKWFEDYGYTFDEQGNLSLAYRNKKGHYDYTQPTRVLERIRSANNRNPALNYTQKVQRARIKEAVLAANPAQKAWTPKQRRAWEKWRKGRMSTESLQHYLVFGREQGALVEERARRMNMTPKELRKENFDLMMRVEKDRRSGMSYEQRKALESLDRNQTPFFLESLDLHSDIEAMRTAGEAVAARLEDREAVTTGDHILHILKFNLGQDNGYSELIDRLLALNMQDIRVSWVDKKPSESFGGYQQQVLESGAPRRMITFNRNKFEAYRMAGVDPAAAFVHSIMHEFTHAATLGAIRNDARVTAALSMIMREARVLAAKQGISEKELLDHYGLRSGKVEEFVAEAFTNQRFQDLLRSIQIEPKRSVWSVFIDLVKRLLGLADTPQADNVLDVVMATTDRLFTGELVYAKTRGASEELNIDDLTVRDQITNYIDKAMQSTRITKNIRERAKNIFEGNKEGGTRFMLSALTMEQIRDFYYKSFGAFDGPLNRYMKAFFQRNADNSANMEEADKLSREWTKLTEEYGTEEDNPAIELSRVMTDATLYGIHPDEQLQSKANEHIKSAEQRNRHADLVRRFRALPPEVRNLYGKLKEYYAETFRKEVNLVTLNSLRAVLDGPFNYTEADIERKKLNTKDGLKKEFGDRLTEENRTLIARTARLPMEHVGPYFPLMRFGEYVVTAERVKETKHFTTAEAANAWAAEQRASDPTLDVSFKVMGDDEFVVTVKEREVRMAETPSEAEQNRQDMIEEYGVDNVDREIQKKSKLYETNSAISSGSGLRSILGKLDGNPAAQAAIKDFYLRSLSDSAFRKREVKRAHRRGVNTDLQHRTFGNYAKAAAYYMSQLRYGAQMAEALIDMDKFTRAVAKGEETSDIAVTRLNDVVNEINTRDKLTHDPIEVDKYIRGAANIAQFMMLVSPSYWMINLTQPYMVTLPWLSARSSVGDAMAALAKAQSLIRSPILDQMGESIGGLKALWSKTSAEKAFSVLEQVEDRIKKHGGARADEYISMLNKLKRDSIIDLSFVAELRDIAEGQNTSRWQKVLDASRIMAHLTEVNNRIMTAIAAYDIKRNQGGSEEEAQGFAKKAVSLTQFNYSAGNAPRLFSARGPLGQMGPLVFQFMKYPQHMYALLIDNMRMAVKGGTVSRPEAIKTLMGLFTTHLAAGGILGATLQPLKWAIGAMIAAFGDDDDPDDFKSVIAGKTYDRWIREMTTELMGTDLGEIVSAGLPRAAGVDLSNRMSLGTLYMMDLNPKTSETLIGSLVQTFGGPSVNLLGNAYGGMQQMSEGQVTKGLEAFLPKGAKDVLRAFRYSNEGLTDATGKEIIGADKMEPYELFVQSLGFQPSRVSEKYAARGAINDKKQYDKDRHDSLMRRWQNADPEGRVGLLKEIAEFNRTAPGNRITRSQLLKSTRRFREDEALSRRYGVTLRGDDRIYAREGDIYEDD